jgi:hypothetical protein
MRARSQRFIAVGELREIIGKQLSYFVGGATGTPVTTRFAK